MKKITLMAMLAVCTSAAANALTVTAPDNRRFDEPVAFTERGISFYVFPDGSIDFNTQPSAGDGIYYRTKPNTSHGAPQHWDDGGVRIEHDSQGRIRRVGNVFLNYDYANRIKRIGSVYMTYHRGRLVQVGGLRVLYDRRGNVAGTAGSVKNYNTLVYNGYAYNNSEPAALNDDFYYYRYDGTKVRITQK